jgi:hypothetical protein
MTSRRRHILLGLLAMWVVGVAYLTLTPAGYRPRFSMGRFFCIWCGEFDGSDMLRNWILFVPGGLLAGLALRRRWALALPIALTCFVELAQVRIPGRDSALQDLILNGLGGLSGFWLARRGLGAWGTRTVAAVAAVAWLAPLALLVPKSTPNDLYGLWTPRLGRMALYDGRIIEASLGPLAIPSHRVDEKRALDSLVVHRAMLHVLLEVGGQPGSTAPVFQINDGHRQDVMDVLALHSDLILRGRTPARILKLDQPDTRWTGAMDGLSEGDTITLVVDRGRDSVCMSIEGSSVDRRERCNLAPSLADGWGHVLYLEGPPLWFRQLMSVAWAIGLGGLIGLCSGSWRSALGFATGLAVVGYVGSVISPDVRPSVFFSAVLVAGALLGAVLRDPVVALWKELRPT